jgi:hypothetical protein
MALPLIPAANKTFCSSENHFGNPTIPVKPYEVVLIPLLLLLIFKVHFNLFFMSCYTFDPPDHGH